MTAKKNSPAFGDDATLLEELTRISRFYGSDPDFVLAGGGNTSAKTDDTLYVKASGQALATIDAHGFVKMDRNKLTALLESHLSDEPLEREEKFKLAICAARLEPEKAQRPSVEVLLHNLIEQKFVVHTRSVPVNILACCDRGREITEELFGNDVLWIGFADPGHTLAKAVARALEDYLPTTTRKAPTAVILQNHGLIIGGEDFEDIRSKTDSVLEKIGQCLEATKTIEPFGKVTPIDPGKATELINVIGPALRALLADSDQLKIATFDDSNQTISLTCADKGPAATQLGPLTPDQIVYCRSFPMCFELSQGHSQAQIVESLGKAITDHKAKHNRLPQVVLVKGLGLFAIGDDYAAAENVRSIYINTIRIMAGASKFGEIHALPRKSRQFIEDWEAEAYRRSIAKGATKTIGRLASKIAVVSGAAQGFGLGIAQELTSQSACVVLADINEQGARDAANELCNTYGMGRAMGLLMDVTDGQSVQNTINQVVRRYGGLDIFISNAGVLKAQSVKNQPVEDFDLVTAVNYRGYFLCVQKAAPILAIQHLAKPDYMSDIIQINSKSGLVGSSRNAAYAGSKFGGIGLTQSFALELVSDGIKVNCLCPGNFFDGPLWSDPQNGLFVQYLRAGKVPSAKTVQDVRKAYEAKVPIGRGCTTSDLVKAIYYLIEQKYETGQALPITGGQVMLR